MADPTDMVASVSDTGCSSAPAGMAVDIHKTHIMAFAQTMDLRKLPLMMFSSKSPDTMTEYDLYNGALYKIRNH
jgi:hypothetical protein